MKGNMISVAPAISKGDFVSFIGPSGCGRTMLPRAIAALEFPAERTLTVSDKTPDAARQARAYGHAFLAVGFCPRRVIAGHSLIPLQNNTSGV